GAHALRVAITLSNDALASSGESVVLAIAQPADPDRSGPITLTGVRARASSSAPVAASLCGRNFGNPDLAAFNRAARRFGVDPSPYIAASDHSAPELLEALTQCPDFEPHALDFGRALFAHYDRLVASTIRLNPQWRQGVCEIELLSDFDGIGWGEVRSFAGYPARGVGPLGRAAIFLHAGVPGAVELVLDCVGVLVGRDLDAITLSV